MNRIQLNEFQHLGDVKKKTTMKNKIVIWQGDQKHSLVFSLLFFQLSLRRPSLLHALTIRSPGLPPFRRNRTIARQDKSEKLGVENYEDQKTDCKRFEFFEISFYFLQFALSTQTSIFLPLPNQLSFELSPLNIYFSCSSISDCIF